MTPSLAALLRNAIRTEVSHLRVSLPGRIERYDASRQRASVQPLLQVNTPDGPRSLPVIDAVPIVWPQGGGAILSFPLKQGDSVLLLFSDRSLEEWLDDGGEVCPQDPRAHDLTDAIAIPGLVPFTNSEAHDSDVRLGFDQTEIRLTQDGSFDVSTPSGFLRVNADGTIALGGAQELVGLIDDLLTQLVNMTVPIPGGTSVPTNVPAFAALKARLQTIKERS